MILRLFQDSAEAIPLMVESCIRFISRHGELSCTTEVMPEAFSRLVAWQSRPVSWDPRWIIKAEHFWPQHRNMPLIFFLFFHFVSCLSGFAINLLKKNVFISLGLQHEGIFRVSGSQVEVNDIKNAFERGGTIFQQEH